MAFKLSNEELAFLYEKTAKVEINIQYDSPECPGGRCGNNCSGTCAWSPCTNSYQATH